MSGVETAGAGACRATDYSDGQWRLEDGCRIRADLKTGQATRLSRVVSVGQSCGSVPRHDGNCEQPQNDDPAFAPLRAVRFTIAALHRGQVGTASDSGRDLNTGCEGAG